MKPVVKDFIAEISVRYSDDTGQAVEKRFAFKKGQTIDDFMHQCSDAFSLMRFTCGVETFDELTKDDVDAKQPEPIDVVGC